MKCIIIMSKHHDGFALFDSAVTDWDVVDTMPYGKDLLKPQIREMFSSYGKLGVLWPNMPENMNKQRVNMLAPVFA